VANEAGNSVVITDTQSNIRHLVEIIKAIDSSAEGETEIRVFRLSHASPTDVANELSQIFPSSNGTGNNQSPIRFGGGGFGRGGGFPGFPGFPGFGGRQAGAATPASTDQNTRIQKQTQVIAVADLRTSSVIVTASKDLMQEIAGMMSQLDVPSDRDQGVYVFQMKNGDAQQAVQVLQNMFQSGTTSRNGTSAGSSQNSPLQTRALNSATSMGTTTTTTTGAGGMGYGGGAGGGRTF
jgi:type II secretory pathway component GspD/PulD (secretin)